MMMRKIRPFFLLLGVTAPIAPVGFGEFSHTVTGILTGETSAIVRASSFLCQQEKNFLGQRRPIVRHALSRFLHQQLSEQSTPTIAFAGSGGGYRAMLATAGSLQAAQELGLLDGTTYLAGVSGSTWLLGPWYASGLTLEHYLAGLIPKLAVDARKKEIDFGLVSKTLLKKFMFGQHVSLIDLYGATIANTLLSEFGDKRYDITLSSTQKNLLDGSMPLPIYTAVEGAKPYDWYEFTPFEVGNQETNCYIPTWALGRRFEGGVSHDFAPEPSLGYLLGVFGAVMSASFQEVYDAYAQKIQSMHLQTLMLELLGGHDEGQDRLFEARVSNFAYRMPYNFSAFKEELTFVDSGFACNIPLPALLGSRRPIDVIIISESSASVATGSELKRAIHYANRKRLPLPTIDLNTIATKHVQVYADNPEAPIIIHLPFIKNDNFDATFDPQELSIDGFCVSSNMQYTAQQAQRVIGLARHNLLENVNIIKEALLLAIERKK